MAREWAAVDLLECVADELSPNRRGGGDGGLERESQAKLDAIRVLPAPVAGDLFVTGAARGDIGVILFYFEEGAKKKRTGGFSRIRVHFSPVGRIESQGDPARV